MNFLKSNRRSFLKLAGTGMAAAVLPEAISSAAAFAAPPNASEKSKPYSRLLDCVNPLQGTNSSMAFSRGNTLPLTAMPHGMAHWTIQTVEDDLWFFRPMDNRCQGIRCTRLLAPWLPDYGYACFLPFSGEIDVDGSRRASSYRSDQFTFSPHRLKVRLQRYRCIASLIPTERCALLEMTFDESGDAGLLIEMPGADAEFKSDTGKGIVFGTTHANGGAVPANFGTYYALQFDTKILDVTLHDRKQSRVALVRFCADQGRQIVRIGTSFISSEQAMRNLEDELGRRNAEDVEREAAAIWETQLGAVRLEGGTEDQRRTFYSSLYRASLFPRIWHEKDAIGNPIHYSPYTGNVTRGLMYADHGYWDVYRAWYPLMSLLYPKRLGEILQAWVNVSKEGGWMPQFPSPGYRACMTGSLIDAVFGDAAAKGIPGFDLEGAYRALHRHATEPGDPDRGYGRKGLEYYLRLGYIPNDKLSQATVETLDSAYGDFCIAQVAKALGNVKDADFFLRRSENWRNVFDPQTRFMRGKNSDGSWLTPFDPFVWGSPYVEGAAWQHRWAVPHNPHGLIDAMGGREVFIRELEKMLTLPPIFKVGVYGDEIHEMSEMAAVDFGQYAHSNEPIHHALYLFAIAGKPSRTQYWVRRVLQELYTPDNYPGDEDTGAMSAWYILSALGFYPLTPGKAGYVLGSPLFNRAIVTSDTGESFTVEAGNNRIDTPYVKAALLNGRRLSSVWIDHHSLRDGGTLGFEMASSET